MNIARNGLKHIPVQKASRLFDKGDFKWSHDDWIHTINSALNDGDSMYNEAYPDAFNGGARGPVGMVRMIHSGPYWFAYQEDHYGDFFPVAYTHEVIAGDMNAILEDDMAYEYTPPYIKADGKLVDNPEFLRLHPEHA